MSGSVDARTAPLPKSLAGVAQLAEHRFSKPVVAGSIPVSRSIYFLIATVIQRKNAGLPSQSSSVRVAPVAPISPGG